MIRINLTPVNSLMIRKTHTTFRCLIHVTISKLLCGYYVPPNNLPIREQICNEFGGLCPIWMSDVHGQMFTLQKTPSQ